MLLLSSSYPDECASDEEIDDDQMSIVSFNKTYQPDSEEDMELVLPSGARVGHRSLMRCVILVFIFVSTRS